MTPEDLIQRFHLAPLTGEGGLYRRTYCSARELPAEAFGPQYPPAPARPPAPPLNISLRPSPIPGFTGCLRMRSITFIWETRWHCF